MFMAAFQSNILTLRSWNYSKYSESELKFNKGSRLHSPQGIAKIIFTEEQNNLNWEYFRFFRDKQDRRGPHPDTQTSLH